MSNAPHHRSVRSFGFVPFRLAVAALIGALALAPIACGGPTGETSDPSSEPAGGSASAPASAQGGEGAPAAVTAGSLEIHRPRATVTPGAGTAAVYLTAVDTGADGDRLVGVATEAAESATLHESVDQDGVHRMVARPEGFEVPAGGALELAPGGKHVMLMGLGEGTGGEDGVLELTLEFERAGTVRVRAEAASAGAAGHDGMDMDPSDH